jgi:cholesterol transport system auxiliary component
VTASPHKGDRLLVAAMLGLWLAGCSLIPAAPNEPPRRYLLEAPAAPDPAAPASGETLLVAQPTARPGFDAAPMAYVKRAYELQYFARSEWVDAPARMLAPLLLLALARDGRFQVVAGASGASAALRLETEIEALQQEFTSVPSRTRFALRAQLVDVASRRVLATQEFEAVEEAPSEDPYGGVVAANRAVDRVLREIVAWCVAEAQKRASARG